MNDLNKDLITKNVQLTKAYNVHVRRELFKPCLYVFLFVHRSNVNASDSDEMRRVCKDQVHFVSVVDKTPIVQ